MWVRLIDRLINTDHVVRVNFINLPDEADPAQCQIVYSDGTVEQATESHAAPLLELLADLVDKAQMEAETNQASLK